MVTEIHFILVFWTGIFLGILHTIMPCEDKAIFCFYAFGVSRDWKQAFRIVNFYGAGLFLMNLIIGAIISYLGAAAGVLLSPYINPFTWNKIAAGTLILSGIIMIIQLSRKIYFPHTDQMQELGESLHTLKSRKRTAFLLGLLAGIPPCLFELAIYLQAINISIVYGWGNGTLSVFFFGIGTWVGLYPLALLGTASGRLSNYIQKNIMENTNSNSFIVRRLGLNPQVLNKSKSNSKEETPQEKEKNLRRSKWKEFLTIEMFSALALILLGLIFMILAILKITIFPETTINPPPPFNFWLD
jgi:sulfite exporter TauE/SafE/preprotein translocase subunit Sss1